MTTNETYTMYGSALELREAAKVLEALLGIRFVCRNSIHWGGDYYLYSSADPRRSIQVAINADEDPEPLWPDPELKTLVYVENFELDSPENVALATASDLFRRLEVKTLPSG